MKWTEDNTPARSSGSGISLFDKQHDDKYSRHDKQLMSDILNIQYIPRTIHSK